MTESHGSAAPKEWNAAAYHVLSEPQFAWGLRVLQRVSLTGEEQVLDAGCGSGRLTRELAGRMTKGFVVACDLSENMTRKAAQTLGDVPFHSVVCGDLTAIPFRGAFDLIFSTATFHWIRNHDLLFRELRKALREGGRLEAQCGGGPNLTSIHTRANALRKEEPFRRYFVDWKDPWYFALPAETDARLLRAGFVNSHCWMEHAPTPFPDAEQFRTFIQTVVMRPYLLPLPSELQDRFLESVVSDAAKDDPPFTLDYWRLNISAIAN